MDQSKSYCQGAQCGHIDGQGRAGSYVLGEEMLIEFDSNHNSLWESGYRYGYCLAAEGNPLPESLQAHT